MRATRLLCPLAIAALLFGYVGTSTTASAAPLLRDPSPPAATSTSVNPTLGPRARSTGMHLLIEGVPTGMNGSVRITGPKQRRSAKRYDRTFDRNTVLRNLKVGRYQVVPTSVVGATSTAKPTLQRITVRVREGKLEKVRVRYRAVPTQGFSVMGKAFLGRNPLVGSTITIKTLSGATVPLVNPTAAKTDSAGWFRILSQDVPPARFIVEASGGKYLGRSFSGTLRGLGQPTELFEYINLATTIAAHYAAAHPNQSFAAASTAVAKMLKLPTTDGNQIMALGQFGYLKTTVFDPTRLVAAAAHKGGISAYLKSLAGDVGTRTHEFAPTTPPNPSTPLTMHNLIPSYYATEAWINVPSSAVSDEQISTAVRVSQGEASNGQLDPHSIGDNPTLEQTLSDVTEVRSSSQTTSLEPGPDTGPESTLPNTDGDEPDPDLGAFGGLATTWFQGGVINLINGFVCSAISGVGQPIPIWSSFLGCSGGDDSAAVMETLQSEMLGVLDYLKTMEKQLATENLTQALNESHVSDLQTALVGWNASMDVLYNTAPNPLTSLAPDASDAQVCAAAYNNSSYVSSNQTPYSACLQAADYAEEFANQWAQSIFVALTGYNQFGATGNVLISQYQQYLATQSGNFVKGKQFNALNSLFGRISSSLYLAMGNTLSWSAFRQQWTGGPSVESGCPDGWSTEFPVEFDLSFDTPCAIVTSGSYMMSVQQSIAQAGPEQDLPEAGIVQMSQSGQRLWWPYAVATTPNSLGVAGTGGYQFPFYPAAASDGVDFTGTYSATLQQLASGTPVTLADGVNGTFTLANETDLTALLTQLQETNPANFNAGLTSVGFVGPGGTTGNTVKTTWQDLTTAEQLVSGYTAYPFPAPEGSGDDLPSPTCGNGAGQWPIGGDGAYTCVPTPGFSGVVSVSGYYPSRFYDTHSSTLTTTPSSVSFGPLIAPAPNQVNSVSRDQEPKVVACGLGQLDSSGDTNCVFGLAVDTSTHVVWQDDDFTNWQNQESIASVAFPGVANTGVSRDVTMSNAIISGTMSASANDPKANANAIAVIAKDPFGLTAQYFDCSPAHVSGTAQTNVDCSVTGLEPQTQYWYRLAVGNGPNTGLYAQGLVGTFRTGGYADATTGDSSNVTYYGATITGTASGGVAAGAANTSFIYGTDSRLQTNLTTVVAAPSAVSGSTAVPISANLSGLQPATTYYYRARAVPTGANAQQRTAFGEIASFTTTQGAVATAQPATSITHNSATLNGQGQGPPGANGTWNIRFVYNTQLDDLSVAPAMLWAEGIQVGSVSSDLAESVSTSLSRLRPGTEYFYRVVMYNAVRGNYAVSSVESFTTDPAPGAAQTGDSQVDGTNVVMNGTVYPPGYAPSASFGVRISYATASSDLGTNAATYAAATTVANGGNPQELIATVSCLIPDTTYYWRVEFAPNPALTSPIVGDTKSFTTDDASLGCS